MSKINIITPVKDSPDTTLKTIQSVLQSSVAVNKDYTIYNDFSSDETTIILQKESDRLGFNIVNLKDITDHPSPNYLLILQKAQAKAIESGSHLIIVESDVVVGKDTFSDMLECCRLNEDAGMIAAVTTDAEGKINFPYLYADKFKSGTIKTKKRLSFCCTLLTNKYLNSFDFRMLDPDKAWFDVTISHKSTELGFSNYLLTSSPVLHKPHSSRPWKQLKYTNPLKYYFLKYTKKRDKI
jgi:hypothetical protein